MFRRSVVFQALPSQAYANLVKQGSVRADAKQQLALQHLDRVYNNITNFYNSGTLQSNPRPLVIEPTKKLGTSPSGFLNMISRQKAAEQKGETSTIHPLSNVKGIYLYGGVGCGKTYLMDVLFKELPIAKKKRVHFHQFMLEVHKTMHRIRTMNRTKDAEVDVVREVAVSLIRDAEVLCFDEIVVADIADAMILRRLFNAFFSIGVCVIFTSNRHPDELYKGGMNRDSFTPFIRMIKERCMVFDMDSSTDYRLTGVDAKTYLAPINNETEGKFKQMFLDACKGIQPKEERHMVFGRDVVVPRALNGVCHFTFAELCGGPLSSADYTVISKQYHTVFISHVPQFTLGSGDNKRRFINMLDTFYQYKVKIVVLAEAVPARLERQLGDMSEEERAQIQGSLTT